MLCVCVCVCVCVCAVLGVAEGVYYANTMGRVRNVRRLVLIILNQIHNDVCSSCQSCEYHHANLLLIPETIHVA